MVVNLFVQHGTLEDAATSLFLVSTVFIVLQSVADILISLVSAGEFFLLVAARKKRPVKRTLEEELVDHIPDDAPLELETTSSVSVEEDDPPLQDEELDEQEAREKILEDLEEEERRMEVASREERAFWGGTALTSKCKIAQQGDVAQMVERPFSIREV